MTYYQNILGTIGNTPIVKVNKFPIDGRKNIFVKLECFNPARSVKDRIAANIINKAEKDHLLDKSSIIVESSSGNTGIALSMISRVKGFRNVVVIDQNCPTDKIKFLKAFGARIVMVVTDESRADDLTEKRIGLVQALQSKFDNVFVPNQYENSAAPEAHYDNTGREIIDFMCENDIRFEAIFISVGTGGTISGVSKRIKEYDSSIKVIGIEPAGSTLFGGEKGPYLQQGPGNYFKPKNLVYDHIDMAFKVSDQDAFSMCRQFAMEEGILIGGSSGAVFSKAVEMSVQFQGYVLCIMPDGGEKYFESIYSDEWLLKNGIKLDKRLENPIFKVNVDRFSSFDDEMLRSVIGG